MTIAPDTANSWTPSSSDELLTRLRAVGAAMIHAYRGEPMEFGSHTSSLGRLLANTSPDSWAGLEALCIQQFFQAGGAELSAHERQMTESSMMGRLLIMQHHGAPTRLLDWTFSPWVAVYHACAGDPEADGRLFHFEVDAAFRTIANTWSNAANALPHCKDSLQFAILARELPVDSVFLYHLKLHTRRTAAQQALVTIANPLGACHVSLLRRHLGAARVPSIVIPAQMKRQLMLELQLMNINAMTLFPGLDGAGRSVRESLSYRIPKMLIHD